MKRKLAHSFITTYSSLLRPLLLLLLLWAAEASSSHSFSLALYITFIILSGKLFSYFTAVPSADPVPLAMGVYKLVRI